MSPPAQEPDQPPTSSVTADLAGHATTTEFTDEVISRIRSKLEVWATLGDG